MPDKIRVLVVDDSMVMRRVVSDILAAEADLDVQPPAAGGALALARLDAGPIDVIVLDVEMPEMSGLDVLEKLRQRRPAPVVIMFSASTQKAASITLEALSLGASDYVTKPSAGSAAASIELVRSQLLPKIRAMGRRTQARLASGSSALFSPSSPTGSLTGSAAGSAAGSPAGSAAGSPTGPATPAPTPSGGNAARPALSSSSEAAPLWPTNPPLQSSTPPQSSSAFGRASASSSSPPARTTTGSYGSKSPSATFSTRAPRPPAPVDIIAIGTSTGGPNALVSVLRDLPSSLSVPIVIVQHMPPVFTKMLAERLTSTTPVPVDEAVHGQVLEPGRAYLAPGDQHMVLQRQGVSVVIHLNKDPPEQSCRPSVDVLFRSVATTHAARSLAVVLTGMGQDGLSGCQVLHAAGAQIVVQDEASSVVWGMPGFVARAGIADAVRPLTEIPHEILRRLRGGAPTPKAGNAWQ